MEPLLVTLITWATNIAPLAGSAIATGFLGKTGENRFFGLSYAMDWGYKGWNPYIERYLAISVNCF